MKKILTVLISVLVVVVLAIVVLPYVLNLNQYKAFIERNVYERTGKHLVIDGDISLQLIPSLKIVAKDVKLDADKDSNVSERLVSIDTLSLDAQLIPLLKGDLQVDRITLKSPQLYVVRLPSGATNWEMDEAVDKAASANALVPAPDEYQVDVVVHDEPVDDAPSLLERQKHAPAFLSLTEIFSFRNIRIEDGKLRYRDLQQGKEWRIQGLAFESSLMRGKNPFDLSFAIENMPAEYANVSISGTYLMNGIELVLEKIKANIGQTKISGNVHLDFSLPVIEVNSGVMLNKLDITQYQQMWDAVGIQEQANADEQNAQAEASETKTEVVVQKGQTGWSDTPLNLSWAQQLNGHIAVKAEELILPQITMRDVVGHLHFQLGKVSFKLKDMKVAGGSVNIEAELDTALSPPTIALKTSLDAVALAELRAVMQDQRYIDGRVSADVLLNSRGVSVKQLIASMQGEGNVLLEEGRIYKLDLLSMARNIAVAFNGKTRTEAETRFSQAKASFKIAKGVLINNDFLMETPVFNFAGKGNVNLLEQSVDYRLDPKVSAGSEIRVVPILIKGKWDKLKYVPDIKAVAKRFLENPGEGKKVVDEIKSNFKSIKDNLGGGIKQLFEGF